MATQMVRRGWLSLAILGALALTSVVGCGGVRHVPVSGTVTLDGQPLNGGYLVFTPDTAKGNTARISCTSRIKDGHYDLETNGVTRAESGSGVPLGWYKVSFRILEESTKKHPIAPINVNEKFKDPEKTPLSVEVKDNPEPGAYDFKLTK
jgi:predicted RNA-binding protein with TRAM domain